MDHQTFRCCFTEHPTADSPELFRRDLDALLNHDRYPPTHAWRYGDELRAWLEWKYVGDKAGIVVAADEAGRMTDWTEPPPNSTLIHTGEPLDLRPRLSDRYRECGFVMLPLDGKACKLHGWTKFTATPKTDWAGKNVGLLLGDASGGLMDIDLDGPGATQLGEILFGDLPASGRSTSRASHRWFTSTGACKTTKWNLGKSEAEAVGLTTDDKCMLVELRGNKNQTMVAPSVHPDTGETVEWHGGFPETFPARDPDEIRARAQLLAALCIVALRWPAEGTRDETALALAGALLRIDWMTVSLCNELIGCVAELGGDNERRDNKAESTAEKLEAGEEVTGWTRVFELCGIESEVLRKLRKWTGAGTDADAPEGACIIHEGALDDIVKHMELVLLNSDELVYQRDTMLVRVTTLPEKVEDDGVILPKGTLTVLPATLPWTTRAVARNGRFMKFSPAAGKYVDVDPPGKYIKMILASAGEWPFPVLHGIINTPILLPDGEVVHESGYHADTGLYLDTKGVTFPPVGTDVGAALDLLRRPFSEYSWDPATNGLSIVLSAILCVLCRNLVPFVPAHAFDAVYPGSGKSYLFAAIAEIALGNPAPSVVMTSSPEENQKRLETALLRATQMLMLDNVSQEVGGDLLCQAVTKDVIEIRVLGRSESLNVKNTTTVLVNGNGLVFYGDFTRRVLVAKIDPGRPDPENAEFAFVPQDVAWEHRADMVMAALTIVREYLLAGCPDLPKPIGSFEKYSLIRGALISAGMPDPCENMQQTKEQDPAAQFMREALSLWVWTEPATLADIANDGAWDDGNRPHRVRELLRLAAGQPMFDARKIGVFLKSWVGRQVNMGDHWLVLQAHARDSGIKKYWVERTDRQGELC